MQIPDYIQLAQDKQESNSIYLVDTEILKEEWKIAPEGYRKVVRWSFSDGTIIRFSDETDTEAGWKAHERRWEVEIKGTNVSPDADLKGVFSQKGIV